jgi:molybdopterin-guanine dinucleotide biosynthesis protein A
MSGGAVDIGQLAAVILAGGAATRFGGGDKPAAAVRGVSMLARVLGAVDGAGQRVVVGPDRAGLPADVLCVREDPPGAGPVAASEAGLKLVRTDLVALLAADLPYLTVEAVEALAGAVNSTVDGAVYVDDAGRRQLLCGVWRVSALRGAYAVLGDPVGRSMRALVGGLRVAEVVASARDLPPWFDCDTTDDLRRAENLTNKPPSPPR